MSIITISRGSYSRGKDVAEKLAQTLGYRCISRDVLLEASEKFNIPEIKLIRALHDAPSVFERFTYGKERYVAYIKAALLKHVQKDNVVYHGLAGHFFLKEIPHVLKVRIIADLEERVQEEMRRENISADEARAVIKKDDEERRRWSLALYGIDTWDTKLYDLVVHIKAKAFTVDDAVNLILCAANLPCFQTKPESQKVLDDLTLAAQVQAALVEDFPTVEVDAHGDEVFVSIKGSLAEQEDVTGSIKRLANRAVGLEVKVHFQYRP
jgi:cytidylate kinase